MQRKILWFFVTCVVIIPMILASCNTSPQVAETTTQTQTTSKATMETTTAAPTSTISSATIATTTTVTSSTTTTKTTDVEKPTYGGTFTAVFDKQSNGFDDNYFSPSSAYTIIITNESMVTGDWAKGPAGTGIVSFAWQTPDPKARTGNLAESWDMPDPNTIVFHVRQGVHFALNSASEASRFVNGRELTADDVAFSWTRVMTNKASNQGSTLGSWFKSATATDKYTVLLKVDDNAVRTGTAFETSGGMVRIWPRDMIQKYGDARDWRNSVGTGAFMLTDYVAGSSYTMTKNPNYWGKDPLNTNNQLPYLDGLIWLDIYDNATRMAAMRTNKIDWMLNVSINDGDALLKTNIGLKWKKILNSKSFGVYWRIDKPDLPFNNLKVREALCMAIDRQVIAKSYYGPNAQAEVLAFPVAPVPEFKGAYTPIDQLPEAAKMTFQYSPEKAKQLLTEAGYPKGFKTNVITANTPAWVDMLSVIKDYWSKINVDLEIVQKESAVYTSIFEAGQHTEMIARESSAIPIPYKMYWGQPGDSSNAAFINDPYLNDLRFATWKFEIMNDQNARDKLLKEASTYYLGLAACIQMPVPYVYYMWQPWVKNYRGEWAIGYGLYFKFVNYIWYDTTLKSK